MSDTRRGRAAAWAVAVAFLAGGCGGPSALETAQEAVEKRPDDAASWVALARQLDAQGKEEEAMYAFSSAFDKGTKDVTAYRRAAELAGNFGRFRDAKAWAELGLWAQKDDRECLKLVARALLSRGGSEAAKAKPYLAKVGLPSLPVFEVSRDRALLAKLRYSEAGPRFEVRTDIGRDKAKQVLATCERIYQRYMELIPGLKPPVGKVRVFMFGDKDAYTEIMKAYAKEHTETEGLTILDPAGMRVIVSNEASVGEGVVGGYEWNNRILLHELTHVALFRAGRGAVPAWIQEGLSEYFAGAEPVNSGFAVGRRLEWRVAELRFLAAKGYKTPAMRGLMGGYSTTGFYPFSWSLVHFFHHGEGGKYQANALEMRKNLGKGMGSSAFTQAFAGVDLARLEAEWKQYVAGL